jgi:uncharacterized protein YdiU (UPF0061 family)
MTATLFSFDNSYARLPERFFAKVAPTPVRSPGLVKINEGLARELGVDPEELASAAGVAALAGNVVPAGAEPLAQVYAGHQFGGWSPRLGDGRAILLGEVIDGAGRRRDVQLKGSGPTPYSRRGDGRGVAGAGAARVCGVRGDARAGGADDAGAGGGEHGRAGASRARVRCQGRC